MAYQKTNWVNGYTPLNASNMNKIEEGIFNNDTFLSSLDIRVNTLEGSIGQGGIGSVVVSGNGNALNNVSYDSSTKILNFEKNNTFALDSDLDSVNAKNLYHLGAYDSVSGNIITRQTGYIIFDGSDDENWTSYDKGFWAYITISDITPTTSQIELGKFIVSRGNAVKISTMVDTSSGIQIGLDGRLLNIRPNVSGVNTLVTFKQWLSQNPIIIQYKLATAYTEQVIEDRPLNTLDQAGSQWVRSEWEKGLNLWSLEQVAFNGERKMKEFLQLLGTGVYSFRITSSRNITYNEFHWYIRDLTTSTTLVDDILPNRDYTLNYDSSVYAHDIRLYAWGTTSSDACYMMFNAGNHAYPYQEYQGGIVREKQLNGKIVKVIEFNAESSTFNNFKFWVEDNKEHIISIVFYNIASGSNSVHNVIFGTDGVVYKYINSEGTFDDVSFSTSGEGGDLLKIYYI